jgi:hypothetical protein
MNENPNSRAAIAPGPAPYRVCSDRRFWLARGLAAAAFAIACALALRTGGTLAFALGLAGLVMFAAFAAYALRQGLRSAPRLTLAASGVEAADLGVGVIAWDAIEHVQSFGSAEAPFIAFHVLDPQTYVARMSPWARFVQRLLRVQGLPAFSVNLIGVDRDPGEIAVRARVLHQQHAAG